MRSDKVRVPLDITAYINKKRAIRISAFIVLEMLLIVALVLWSDDIFDGEHSVISYIIFGCLMILPGYWLKIKFWLFDKSWAGEILQKNEETYYATDNKATRSSRLQINKCQKLKIQLDSGKIIEYTVYNNRARHAFRNNTYNVSDRVIHVSGTNYLQAVAVGDDDTLICVVCGAESRADTPECLVCGKTLKID